MTNFTRRLFLGAAATSAPAFARLPARAENRIALHVTAAHSTEADMYRLLASAFEAKYPGVSVKIDASLRDRNALIQAKLRDSLSGQVADVSVQGNNKLRLYVDLGMAVDLSDAFNAEIAGPQTTPSPSVGSIRRFRDRVYGLGFLVSAPVVFFDLDLVRKAGGDPTQPPVTWEGILDLAAKINDRATSTVGAYYTYDQADWFWITLIESQGASMMRVAKTHIGFDNAAGLKALRLLKAFGAARQSKTDMPRDQVRQLFVAGKLGLFGSSNSLGISKNSLRVASDWRPDWSRVSPPLPTRQSAAPSASFSLRSRRGAPRHGNSWSSLPRPRDSSPSSARLHDSPQPRRNPGRHSRPLLRRTAKHEACSDWT